MKNTNTYARMRNAGYTASEAHRAVKIENQFADRAASSLVRLRAEPEEENYFHVYGEPVGYVDGCGRRVTAVQERKDIEDQIDRLGCWFAISEWRTSEDDAWQIADSIGMLTGYQNPLSPVENCYVLDLMRAALDALENAAIAPAI